jgi:hypothetical protein
MWTPLLHPCGPPQKTHVEPPSAPMWTPLLHLGSMTLTHRPSLLNKEGLRCSKNERIEVHKLKRSEVHELETISSSLIKRFLVLLFLVRFQLRFGNVLFYNGYLYFGWQFPLFFSSPSLLEKEGRGRRGGEVSLTCVCFTSSSPKSLQIHTTHESKHRSFSKTKPLKE